MLGDGYGIKSLAKLQVITIKVQVDHSFSVSPSPPSPPHTHTHTHTKYEIYTIMKMKSTQLLIVLLHFVNCVLVGTKMQLHIC